MKPVDPQEFMHAPGNGVNETPMKLNSDQTVAVSTDYFWNEDFKTCPRSAKVQLLSAGGVAVYGHYAGDPFWKKWAPLPRNRPDADRRFNPDPTEKIEHFNPTRDSPATKLQMAAVMGLNGSKSQQAQTKEYLTDLVDSAPAPAPAPQELDRAKLQHVGCVLNPDAYSRTGNGLAADGKKLSHSISVMLPVGTRIYIEKRVS